ncbi:MAG: YhbY family RNA-binding protein, partial [Myxococcales bacterium]|nr:YhbY family RNA-binding protein [Myxococcales bacterium]
MGRRSSPEAPPRPPGARRSPPRGSAAAPAERANRGAGGAPRAAGTLLPVTSAPLSGRARTHLKSLAHPLEPIVQVGAQGITDALIEAVG